MLIKEGLAMSGKVNTTLIIDKALHDRVKALAAADKRSVNSLINKLLQVYVDSKGGK
jgi:predicted HicB family RNase H-like nuclease